MKEFLNQDFLLNTPTAQHLYHTYAKDMPIFDFHCHLSPKEIYEDKQYADLAEVWLGGDHYKWRLMREMGVEERYITGDASGWEKFEKYAEVLPYAIGNPIYHWTHLELRRYFDIHEILSKDTAKVVWEKANKKLITMTARQMIKHNKVRLLFTTDDPCDDLQYHKLMFSDDTMPCEVAPAFRPDKGINIELDTFPAWIKKLSEVTHSQIFSINTLLAALSNRIKYFDSHGCVCSDHALDVVMYEPCTREGADAIFQKRMKGERLTTTEIAAYKGFILTQLGKEYSNYKWVQQYHIGALRNNSTKNMQLLGADTGFDAIADQPIAQNLSSLLDSLQKEDCLPKTILYCLNPRDNEVLAAIRNCFQAEGVMAKIQFGSAWWFNDQKDGMERQLEALAQFGLLSKFVGMLTDSRSFLSYTRHEYFRRVLCNKLGDLIESGQYPNDTQFVGKVIADICYHNAINYFKK